MKKLNILFFVMTSIILNAQTITGKILSKDDGKPVPYAKIGVDGENMGAIADNDGIFTMNFDNISKDKTVKIEVGGYDALAMPVNDFIQKKQFFLREKVRDIAEVQINPKKFVSKKWGNDFSSKKMVLNFWPKSIIEKRQYYTKEQMDSNFRELAILFTNHKKVKVNKININFANFKVEKPVKYRFVFYNNKDGKPGELLDFPEIFADIDNKDVINGTFSLDISDKNIWIDKDFFLSLQMLSNDFEGEMRICVGFLGKPNFYRKFVSNWEPLAMKLSTGVNIDVKVEK